MKKAGELLSQIIDGKILSAVEGHSRLCACWRTITAKHRIAAAADHARIVHLDRHILLIETDHPGWIQILQTKQRELLHEFQRGFPDLLINGVSFRLSRKPLTDIPSADESEEQGLAESAEEPKIETTTPYAAEKMDGDLRETFKRLEQHIILRNNMSKKRT
ncbi:MAG: DUF721 domain-containing protein [Treponema sp.]|jgi:hypothetical protein|nr:DUF721 domain-containing protein [Treponema sp.]